MNNTLSIAWTIARRELRGGLTGFRIFLACLTLGVAAIATVQSLSGGIIEGLRADGRAILGGDVALRVLYNPIGETERAYLESRGRVSTGVEARSMARREDGARSTLVELKAVDDLYPLYGSFTLREGGNLRDAIGQRDGVWGAVVEETVRQRLDLNVGDAVKVGDTTFRIRGTIEREPDRAASGGFVLGPRLLIDLKAMESTGLIQPGSMITWNYRIGLNPRTDLQAWQNDLQTRFPDAGWRVRDFTNAAPQIERFIERLTLFLTLVGLTALLVGGVGVGNAVRSYLDGKVATIATLKCLGAPGPLVFRAYLLQILVLASLGIVLGLIIGAVAPLIAAAALANVLPITARVGVYPGGLAIAAAFGLLTALTFSLWPLGRAREVPAGALFRDVVSPAFGRPRGIYLAAGLLSGAALGALAILTAQEKMFAAWFVGGAFLTLLAFRFAASGVTWAASRVGRPRNPGFRLALANLHRPGNPTGSVVLSLGLGLTVLVAIALIQGNFSARVNESIPKNAPAYFFIDIQPNQRAEFDSTVLGVDGASDLHEVPMLRGRITRANGVEAEKALVKPEHAWVLRGDRGITYSGPPPENAEITAGQWWPADYKGKPLVSIYADIAAAFGIGLGDTLTVNVLGRDITAEVASIRAIDFSTMNINFTIIFSPGLLEGAPQTFLATVRATPEAEPKIQRAVTDRFGNITSVRVRDALDTVNEMLANIGTAVRVTAAITLLAGTLVLAGAVAAGHRRRVYDAVVLKVLGATRADVLKAFLVEYGLLGLITAAISGAIGTLTAWAVLVHVMDWEWTFLPSAVLTTAVICTAITLAFGFVGTWRALGQPAAPLLRND